MSTTKTYTPFTFTTSFDELEKSDLKIQDEEKKRAAEEEKERIRLEEEAKEAPPPPPTFSEEELAEAKAAAWEEGRQAGEQQALASIAQQTEVALQTITGHLAILQDRQSLANESQAASLSRIASEMVRKMMPVYAAEHGVEEIKSLIHASLAPLETKGRVNITIPETLQGVLEEKIDEVAHEAGFEGRLVYVPDGRLSASDVRVDWGRGSAERNLNEALAEMDSIIEQFLENHLQAEELDAEQANHDLVDEEPPVEMPTGEDTPMEPATIADSEETNIEQVNLDAGDAALDAADPSVVPEAQTPLTPEEQ